MMGAGQGLDGPSADMGTTGPVYLECGSKRTFASAVEWPGWARAGRDEGSALAALVEHGRRYRAVLVAVGLDVALPASVDELAVVERLVGGSGTDFGALSMVPSADERPLDGPELGRQLRLLTAAWAAYDRAEEAARGVTLRTGPRGGGRGLDRMLSHVVEAEAAYLVQVGARSPKLRDAEPRTLWMALRRRTADVLAALVQGDPVEDPSRAAHPWPVRYHVRRAAWHVLDHAWEIEDRASPA